jgi:hypothetical protein
MLKYRLIYEVVGPIAPPNLQGLALVNDRLITTFDLSTDNITSISFTGTAQNLGPLLE